MNARSFGIVLIVSACSSAARLDSRDAERTVAEFYQWYVPLAHDSALTDMRAIRERSQLFSPRLTEALRADSLASAQSPNEVVGLDGDPFLNSQDPCDRYSVVSTVQRDTTFLVAVRGSGGCAAHTNPDVTVEVTVIRGQPVFTNFVYSSTARDNLVATLEDLAKARRSARPVGDR